MKKYTFIGNRRVQLKILDLTGDKPMFAVSSLKNDYHPMTAFSRGELHYYGDKWSAALKEIKKFIPDFNRQKPPALDRFLDKWDLSDVVGGTVKDALDEKREELKGKVAHLYLCKGELFYGLKDGKQMDDSVYPVSLDTASEEAEFFGVEVHEV